MYTINLKDLKDAAICMGKEQGRHYLNGIYFNDDKLISTDGHKMIIVKREVGIVRIDHDKKQFICYATREFYIEELNFDGINPSMVIPFDIVDGTFPDYRRVIPDAKNYKKGVPSAFNMALLAPFKDMGVGELWLNSTESSAMIIRFDNAIAVIVPMRGRDVMDNPIPEWFDKKEAKAA